MRDTFVKTLVELAKTDTTLELLTGDLGFGVLKPFWEQCPNQFTNAGIAEQNMTTMAAGMALVGKNVFTYSIGNFPTLRCIEQIRNDCAYHNANVKIVCVGGGFAYGPLGMSHHATEDLAILRALPNVAVLAPGDVTETIECTKALARYKGTAYLRLGRGGEKQIHSKIENFQIGKGILVCEGKRVAIFSSGAIFDEVLRAKELLHKQGIYPSLYSFPTIKPIDESLIRKCVDKYEIIVTCEEHNIIGGFGSAVAEIMSSIPSRAKLIRIGINDTYADLVGNQQYLRDKYRIDSISIFSAIIDNL